MNDPHIASISQQVIEELASWPAFFDWPGCRQALLGFAAQDAAWSHAMPVLGCLAAGGQVEDALPVAAAWTTLRHAANALDEIQDGRSPAPDSQFLPAQASACAVAMLFAAFSMISSSSYPPGVIAKVTEILSLEGFKSGLGQSLGFGAQTGGSTIDNQLQHYWKAAILKSGSIYRAGLLAGASTSPDLDVKTLHALGEYGLAFGVILQILDDARDTQQDLRTNRRTLPWLLIALDEQKRSRRTAPEIPTIQLKATSAADWSEQLAAARVPETISSILAEWQRRAQASLDQLPGSDAKEKLREVLEYVLFHPGE